MAILTDLPNELLLSIIADVSPLYIDYFLLTNKRMYGLRADVITAHNLVRTSILNKHPSLRPSDLLRSIVFEDPKLALYLLSWRIGIANPRLDENVENLVAEIDVQVSQNPYIAPRELEDCENFPSNAGDQIIPLLITRLLNLRKLNVNVFVPRYLLETVLRIVEVSHDPTLGLQEPWALGRLREAHIYAAGRSINGMELGILLAMIPSLRKLYVEGMSQGEPYTCTYQRHPSGVTEIVLGDYVHLSYIEELVGRTHALRRFTYNYETERFTKLQLRLLVELLKQHARQSLTYLRLLSLGWLSYSQHRNPKRNHQDLSMGSLRDFPSLKTLATGVDMFITTRGHGEYENGTGAIQTLVSWLPASLETLVLQKGLEGWDEDVLRMLFRGLRNNKPERLPNLRLIHLLEYPNFDQAMPDDLKTTYQEAGVKIGHAAHLCGNPVCNQAARQLEQWEDLPWIAELEECCQLTADPPYRWVSM